MVSTWAVLRRKTAPPAVSPRIFPPKHEPERPGEAPHAPDVARPVFAPEDLLRNAIRRRAVEAVIWGMPVVGFDLMYQEMVRKTQGSFNSILYWPRLPDWKNQTLSPEPDAIYLMAFFDTRSGPLVLEIPPSGDVTLSGSIMNRWQAAIADIGPGGVDKGEGGKYLVLPPHHDRGHDRLHDRSHGMEGFIATSSDSCLGYAVIRIVPASAGAADVERAVAYAKTIRLYGLRSAENPPHTVFVDAGACVFDATVRYDLSFFESVHRMVDAEPWLERDRAMIEPLKTIGIERGKPFAPDAETMAILGEAAAEAKAWLDYHYDRQPAWHGHWFAPISQDVARNVASFWRTPDSYPTGKRALACSMAFLSGMDVGDAPHTLMARRDREGRALEGARRYRLTIPPAVPASGHWTIAVYDQASHALIRNMPWACRSSLMPELKRNADGSVDIWLGAAAPPGREANWIAADAAGRFEVLARFHEPGRPLLNKSWRLPDIERID